MLPDITDLPWYTAAYPYLAPDAPEKEAKECKMCGEDLTEHEILCNEHYCSECQAKLDEQEDES
jgi:hypothetical protein